MCRFMFMMYPFACSKLNVSLSPVFFFGKLVDCWRPRNSESIVVIFCISLLSLSQLSFPFFYDFVAIFFLAFCFLLSLAAQFSYLIWKIERKDKYIFATFYCFMNMCMKTNISLISAASWICAHAPNGRRSHWKCGSRTG